MTSWSSILSDWSTWSARFLERFPMLEKSRLDDAWENRADFEDYLANSAELTRLEAGEEVDDLIYLGMLAREANASTHANAA